MNNFLLFPGFGTIQFAWTNLIQSVAHRLPNRTLFYLNHSEIFDLKNVLEAYKTTVSHKGNQKWQKQATLYLRQCNKSTAILTRGLALKIYKNLTNINAPVVFGKDVLHENFYGYGISGQMPLILHLRQNYIFQVGICSFWEKFMDYVLDLEVNIRFRDDSDEKLSFDQYSSTARNVLMLIPTVGLLICLLIFLHEVRHFGRDIMIFAKNNFIWRLKTWQLHSHSKNLTIKPRRILVSTSHQ